MPKVIVVYESVYGNTKQVAEAIIEGMKEAPGIEVHLKELKEVASDQLSGYDAILVGSPNYIGRATRGIRKFIDRLGKLNLKGKTAAVFDTYGGKAYQQATGKMEKQLAKKAPGLKLIAPGLSVRVENMKGPISEGELPRCREFGSKLAAQIKGYPPDWS